MLCFSQPELCCCTSQLVAYICLLKPAGTPTSPHKWLNMSGVPLQLTEHTTASKGTLQLQLPPVGLFVLPSVLPTISTAATMCSEVPPTYHTVVPTSINLLQHSARQHTKKKKGAEISSVFSLISNLITHRFLCASFHIHQCGSFGPETSVLLQSVHRRSP